MPYEKQDLLDVAENGLQTDIEDAARAKRAREISVSELEAEAWKGHEDLGRWKPKTVMRTFFEDPGHGWLEVQVSELRDLGIFDKITHYSYRKGGTAYLEEDCDAPTYLKAQRARGVTVEHVTIQQDPTPIRNYPSFC